MYMYSIRLQAESEVCKVLVNAVSNAYLYLTDSKLYSIGFTVEEK